MVDLVTGRARPGVAAPREPCRALPCRAHTGVATRAERPRPLWARQAARVTSGSGITRRLRLRATAAEEEIDSAKVGPHRTLLFSVDGTKDAEEGLRWAVKHLTRKGERDCVGSVDGWRR